MTLAVAARHPDPELPGKRRLPQGACEGARAWAACSCTIQVRPERRQPPAQVCAYLAHLGLGRWWGGGREGSLCGRLSGLKAQKCCLEELNLPLLPALVRTEVQTSSPERDSAPPGHLANHQHRERPALRPSAAHCPGRQGPSAVLSAQGINLRAVTQTLELNPSASKGFICVNEGLHRERERTCLGAAVLGTFGRCIGRSQQDGPQRREGGLGSEVPSAPWGLTHPAPHEERGGSELPGSPAELHLWRGPERT